MTHNGVLHRGPRRTASLLSLLIMVVALVTTAAPSSAANGIGERDQLPPAMLGADGPPTLLEGAPCGTHLSIIEKDHDPDDSMGVVKSAPLRSGTGPSCEAFFQIMAGKRVNPWCYTYAPSNGYTWTYVHYRADGVSFWGWVRDSQLEGYGSYVHCPELD